MGYVFAMGPCLRCGRVFSFNPHRVPSIRVNGEREPVCRPCYEHLARLQQAAGMKVLELPHDAYEPLPEEEL